MQDDAKVFDSQGQEQCIAAFLAGDDTAADSLHATIRPAVCNAVSGFLSKDHPDRDDVVQESVLAVFNYVRRRGEFTGRLENFAATVARNRCRDVLRARRRHPQTPVESLQDWADDDSRSPLDHLTDVEMKEEVRRAVAAMGADCRDLLRTLYFAGNSVEQVRRKLGLGSIHTVYYRRNVCLKKVLKILKKRCL